MTTQQNNHRFVLGIWVTSLGALFTGALVFAEIPEANERILGVVAGILLGWGGAVVQFYYGSSEGSKDKDETIRDIHTDYRSAHKRTHEQDLSEEREEK
jgi:hypothetical protein